MSKEIDLDDNRWLQVKVRMVLQYVEFFHYPFCVDLNENKRVMIEYDPSSVENRFEKLMERGLGTIYMLDSDLMSFMRDVKNAMEDEPQVSVGDMTPEQILNEARSINTCYEFINDSFAQLGFSRESIEVATQINRRCMKLVRDIPNIVVMLRRLRNELNPQFVACLLTGCFASCVVDAFSWGSEQIKEKVSLGAMLVRLNWEPRHYEVYANGERSSELVRLPTELAAMLRKLNEFPREVIEIVEQCFEKPDGSGFPRGLAANNIGRLSALQMVSMDFVSELIRLDFDYSKRAEIMSLLHERYQDGSFKQVVEGIERQLAA